MSIIGVALTDIVGGFIAWLCKGGKTNLKDELNKKGWRNEAITFLTVISIIVIVFLIIILTN